MMQISVFVLILVVTLTVEQIQTFFFSSEFSLNEELKKRYEAPTFTRNWKLFYFSKIKNSLTNHIF